MKRFINYILIAFIGLILWQCKPDQLMAQNIIEPQKSQTMLDNPIKEKWENSNYRDILSYTVFETAMKAYESQSNFKSDKIAIIDFTKPSSEKRLYIIDLEKNALLFNTLVAHGKNTGENDAIAFSNEPQSLKSSFGLFKTAEIYQGKHGYSLRLDGLEEGINDKARERAIVMHGADYVHEDFVKTHGRLGRSWGCPAVPTELSKPIIDAIANGYCLYIYKK